MTRSLEWHLSCLLCGTGQILFPWCDANAPVFIVRSTLCSVMAQLTEDVQPSFERTLKSKAVSENCNVKFTCVVSGRCRKIRPAVFYPNMSHNMLVFRTYFLFILPMKQQQLYVKTCLTQQAKTHSITLLFETCWGLCFPLIVLVIMYYFGLFC